MGRGSDETGWAGLLDEETQAKEITPAPHQDERPTEGDVSGRNAERGPTRTRRRPVAPVSATQEPPPRGTRRGRNLSLPIPGPNAVAPSGLRTDGPAQDLAGDLAERLTAPTPEEAAPARPSAWQEYREVLLSLLGGIVLVGGAILYTQWSSSADVAPKEVESRRLPVDIRGPVILPQAEPLEDVPESTENRAERPVKTRTPMLSVVSSPAGALVDIGGIIYGKTPLVMPSPNADSLDVTLKLGGFRTWTEVVRPNETGHFSVNVKLETP